MASNKKSNLESYSSLLSKLLNVNIHGGIKLGLDNMLHLDARLDHPSQAFPSIHIAGTNGKGSVSTKIAAALQASGLKVGLYTSPHISTFRERIKINGVNITEEEVADYLSKLFALTETSQIPATFFELTTMMALMHFAKNKIDFAVMETGLGGRYDATNIVKTRLSVITSISLEHTEYLGNTIEAIAKEKAGIIKLNVPVILGPRLPSQIFIEEANSVNSPYTLVIGSYTDFCKENEAIAKASLQALNIPQESIDKGLCALPPCRIEEVLFAVEPKPFAVILDVAHNPDGLMHLMQTLKTRYPTYGKKIRFVIGLSKSKDLSGCFKTILPFSSHLHLIEAKNGRAAPIVELEEVLQDLGIEKKRYSSSHSITESIQEAIALAAQHKEILAICGTFFIMSEARRALGIAEERDPEDMNER